MAKITKLRRRRYYNNQLGDDQLKGDNGDRNKQLNLKHRIIGALITCPATLDIILTHLQGNKSQVFDLVCINQIMTVLNVQLTTL